VFRVILAVNTSVVQDNWRPFSAQCFPISERAQLFLRFPGLAHLSFW